MAGDKKHINLLTLVIQIINEVKKNLVTAEILKTSLELMKTHKRVFLFIYWWLFFMEPFSFKAVICEASFQTGFGCCAPCRISTGNGIIFKSIYMFCFKYKHPWQQKVIHMWMQQTETTNYQKKRKERERPEMQMSWRDKVKDVEWWNEIGLFRQKSSAACHEKGTAYQHQNIIPTGKNSGLVGLVLLQGLKVYQNTE